MQAKSDKVPEYSLEDLLKEHEQDIIDNHDITWIRTGIPQIDLLTGGGLPSGRIIEIYGPEASGKTTIALRLARVAADQNKRIVYIDMEHSLNIDWAKAITGIDIEGERELPLNKRKFLLAQPDSMEQGLNLAEDIARVNDGSIGLIVFDSVAAGSPQKELDGNMEDNTIGLQARLMSQAMRKLKGRLNKNKISAVFINQERDKIGSYMGGKTTSGGVALRYYQSIRMRVSRVETLKNSKENYAIMSKIETKKNKLYSPYKTAMIQIDFSDGLQEYNNIINFAVEADVIERAGAYYYIDKEKDIKFRGKSALLEQVKEDKEVYNIMKEKVDKIVDAILQAGKVELIDTDSEIVEQQEG